MQFADQFWPLASAAMGVSVAAVSIRLFWRRRKSVSDL